MADTNTSKSSNRKRGPRSKPEKDSKDKTEKSKVPSKRNGVPRSSKSRNDKTKARDIKNDYKYLEITKLIRYYKPITINGIPLDRIVEQVKEVEDREEESTEGDSKGEEAKEVEDKKAVRVQAKGNKLSPINKYLINFFRSQPTSPIYLSFMIQPSDPDFPYDLDYLKISLCVPSKYPYKKEDRPSIVVLNDNIPRGFSINMEDGFKKIVRLAMMNESDEEIKLVKGKGLLSQIQTLDKCLELFLKQEKRETIKFVKTKVKQNGGIKEGKAKNDVTVDKKNKEKTKQPNNGTLEIPKERVQYRNELIDELVSKQVSIKLFKKTLFENKYKLDLPINKVFVNLPKLWNLNKQIEIFLSVPKDYPNQNIIISLPNNFNKNLILKYNAHESYEEIKSISNNFVNNFNKYKFKSDSLLTRLNFLVNNLGVFCLEEDAFERWNKNMARLVESIQ